jgi:DNA-binding transcriptional LysR family regulator
MIDSVTINQLRAFVAVCDEASFSMAARRLRRAQSAISHAISALESSLGVTLFLREGGKPELTAAGRSLLADARGVIARTEELKTRARSIAAVGAPVISIAVDAYFPRKPLLRALVELRDHAPSLQMKLFASTMRGGEALVLEGRCDLALIVADSPRLDSDRIERRYLCETRFVTVCAPSFPLGQFDGPVPSGEFERHNQLVITDHDPKASEFRKGVAGELNWLLADLGAKHDFLLAGLGWGHMPEDRVADDLAQGRLVKLKSLAAMERSTPLAFVIASLRGHERSESESWLIARLADREAGVGSKG